ncbi:MAG: galactitol-1-phosphate 5-dehydrogenase [Clostridia bacterium]|nr:galactitol-1-phosphate 5-dehydrogenase [Clostridia bacterium]
MYKLMQAAVLHAPSDLRIEQVRIPAGIGGDEVLVKVRAAGICGSDLDRVMKSGTYSFPTIPGHEFCGEIAEVGAEVRDYKKGDRVAVAPMLPCFTCEFCQQGNYGQCDSYNFLGSRTDGAFAQYVKAPARNLIRMPDSVSFMEGAAIEPAAVTLHGMRKVGVNVGDTVAVLGCGAIGLFAIQFAKIMGATNVIAVDIAADKLELADKIGADRCINALEGDVVQAIKDATDGKGVNVAVETAGVSLTQEQCLRIAKKQGRVLYLGTAHRDVVIPPKSFECIVRNEITIVGAWNSYSAPFPGVEWHATLEYIKAGSLKINPLITHTVSLDKAPQVFNELAERKYPFNKVIFVMD